MRSLPALILSSLLLASVACGSADARRQHAADAIAGTRALAAEDSRAVREAVAPGVVAHVEGAVGARQAELPPPRSSAAQIQAAPTAYSKDAERQRDDTLSGLGVLGWIAGAGAIFLGALKATGMGGPVVSMLAGLLQNKAQKLAGQKTQHIADAGVTIIELIEQLPNDGTIGDLKKRVAKTAGPEAIAIIHEVKAHVRPNQAQ